jgi:hypothetical protein
MKGEDESRCNKNTSHSNTMNNSTLLIDIRSATEDSNWAYELHKFRKNDHEIWSPNLCNMSIEHESRVLIVLI